MLRRCGWDGNQLPYVPDKPVTLFWVAPGSTLMRVCVPNHKGEYAQLVRGVEYFEEVQEVIPLVEMPPPPLHRHAGTQVGFEHLLVPPPEQLSSFLVPEADGPEEEKEEYEEGEAELLP